MTDVEGDWVLEVGCLPGREYLACGNAEAGALMPWQSEVRGLGARSECWHLGVGGQLLQMVSLCF
jgi:hypothetical protein